MNGKTEERRELQDGELGEVGSLFKEYLGDIKEVVEHPKFDVSMRKMVRGELETKDISKVAICTPQGSKK